MTVPVIGNHAPHCLLGLALHRIANLAPPFVFDAVQKRTKVGLTCRPVEDWDPAVSATLYRMAATAFTLASQRDYARLDYRVDANGDCWFLEMTLTPRCAQERHPSPCRRTSRTPPSRTCFGPSKCGKPWTGGR